ncbi:MAG: RNA polymerase sigma factor [Alphaproteobacteria bacterium]
MERVREGDHEAFRILHERHSKPLQRYVFGMVANLARAEEIVQDVFLNAFRASGRWEPAAKVSTWLYTIAHNLCLNENRRLDVRAKGRFESLDDPGEGEDEPRQELPDPAASEGERQAVALELEERVRVLVASLPEAQRTALVLSRSQDLRYQEIAEILNTSEQAVKSLVFRATRTLKEGLKDHVDG